MLENLNNTDRELLRKYSKVYFLNENYEPKYLISIPLQYVYESKKEKFISGEVWPFLQKLLDDANIAGGGVNLKVISAYRSFGEQGALKREYITAYGFGANRFSADQGYSEHQLGTAVDFTTQKTGRNFAAFEKTKSYIWLSQNAHTYGFILSYPKNNKYYIFEPWHWRFVGKGLALKLHDEHKNFYEFEQREIDEHLVSFFEP